MGTIRLYEFSRTSGVPSKDLLTALEDAGFKVASHMSVLTEKEIAFLEKKFAPQTEKKTGKKKVVPVSAKEAKPTKKAKAKEEILPQEPVAKKEEIKKDIEVVPEKIMKQPAPVPASHKIIPQQNEKPVELHHEMPAAPVKKPVATLPEEITIESMKLSDFADKIHRPASDIILTLLKLGIMATKNQILTEDIIERLLGHFQIKAKKRLETVYALQNIAAREGEFLSRSPVVVVLGHVDHGKTTLLDFIRKTRVAAREKGGITQHLGAYEVQTTQGNIIFLDTPGHEAFTKIRGRGVGVADIAVLVVAADDGIMPQTEEAIKYAKTAEIPIIVAINKVDKVEASRLNIVKQELSRHELLPEEWGGSVVCVPISAKFGTGVDHLLEMILLQAQLMELRATATGQGIGYVLEAKIEKGRGAVATVLAKHGSIKVGDFFVGGNTVGKVSSLVNSAGQRLLNVGPAVPIQVAGFEELPDVGSIFKVVDQNEYRTAKSRLGERKTILQKFIPENAMNLAIKTDSLSSKEALLESLAKLSKDAGQEYNIVLAGVGAVTESDVILANTTHSSIITLHVKPEANAALLARNYDVSIETYDIIYKLLEALEALSQSSKPVKMVSTKIGDAIVRQVFAIKNVGVVAGCYVSEGRFTREGKVKVFRRNRKVGEGKILSLQRERKVVKEVHTGFECGIIVENLEDFAVDDRIECYIEMPAKS